jgi:DNA-binding Lrp family transcriptional regulator
MDDTDGMIIEALRKNSRRSYRELAKEVGLSPAALINRVKELEKERIVKGYTVSLDLLKLGYEFMGFVSISIDAGKLIETQEKISKLRGVYSVYDLTGEYDSVALIVAKSRNEFSGLIKKIHNTPHVKKTNTNVILNVVKDPFMFNEI